MICNMFKKYHLKYLFAAPPSGLFSDPMAGRKIMFLSVSIKWTTQHSGDYIPKTIPTRVKKESRGSVK
ncbi:hypothetical protein HZS_7068 [Henneguya salminicola]|nr:hypothetical protein HZS_7068 [Henneguya salminicola]